jgi:uncharacterized integral membrane protein
MEQTFQSGTPASPRPDQFGLTDKRAGYFKKASEPNLLIILLALVVNISACIYLVEVIFPHADLPLLVLLFLSVYPGWLIGIAINTRRISKSKISPDFRNYLEYCSALKGYREQVANRDQLLRKMRRQEFRNQRTKHYEERKQQEWWKGLDGSGFELGVAKLLMDKGYNVRHTGSSYGDEGIDVELKVSGRRIIIQCKAFRNYVSAGPVRELYGTLTHQKADEGWLVVTSGFYSGARTFAQGKPIRLFTARELTRLPSVTGRDRA